MILSTIVPTEAQFHEIQDQAIIGWRHVSREERKSWWAYLQAHPEACPRMISPNQIQMTLAVRDLVLIGAITLEALERSSTIRFNRPFSEDVAFNNKVKDAFREAYPEYSRVYVDWDKAKKDALWLIKAGYC